MALVYIRPDADVVDGSWVNESASNTNLYNSLNETSPIDTDFIRSSNLPANDIVTLRLSNFAGAVTEPMTVYYRYKAVSTSGDPLSLKVRLVQGAGGSPATTIAEWEHSDAAATYQDASQLLSTAQFNAITDFDDLFLEFEAITGALGAQLYAYGLLANENDGFAIDATVYDVGEEAYVGGPIGGTLAVKGHTTNYTNVALDDAVLSQTGTSPKMVQFPTAPYVRWTPHNMALESQTLATSPWGVSAVTVTTNDTTAPDGTTTADKLAATTADGYIVQTLSGFVVGFTYTFSVWLKASSPTTISLYWVDGGATGTSCDVTTSWQRFTATRTITTDTTPDIQIGGGSSFSSPEVVYAWGAQVNRGTYATPYLATTTTARIGIPLGYDIAQGQFGVLIEPAATNLCTYSEQHDNAAWSYQVTTPTADQIAAPDGATTADLHTHTGTNGYGRSAAFTSGTTAITMSIFAKAGNVDFINIQCSDFTANAFSWSFNLATGVAGSSGTAGDGTSSDKSITAVGNGWYRLSITGSFASSHSVRLAYNLGSSLANAESGTTANGQTVYLWGAQAEINSVATSYIPTLGATSTRATDNLDAATSTMPFSATKGTVYADYKPTISGTAAIPASFDNGTADERIYVRTHTDTNAYVTVVDGGGAPQADIDLGNTAGNTRTQITACWQANDFDGSVDGGAVQSDPGGTLPTVTNLQFGQTAAAAIDQPLWLYRLSYVPRQVETEGP